MTNEFCVYSIYKSFSPMKKTNGFGRRLQFDSARDDFNTTRWLQAKTNDKK